MYLVTGATGNVGSEMVAQLLASGETVRVFTRDAAKVAHWGDRVQVAIGDFAKPGTFANAFTGVAGAFLMGGGPDGEPFAQLIAAAKAQGNVRLVFLSTILAGSPEFQIGKLHKDKEDTIRASSLPARFVRAGGFMTNSYRWIDTIKTEGVVYNPMGAGKFAPIAPEDIAAVAVKALTAPGLSEEVLEVTGGELLNVPEQVSILAEILGKPIRCVDVSIETAIQNFIRAGVPPHLAAAVAESFQAVRDGRAPIVKNTVVRVTGKTPKTFEVWAREHVSRFA